MAEEYNQNDVEYQLKDDTTQYDKEVQDEAMMHAKLTQARMRRVISTIAILFIVFMVGYRIFGSVMSAKKAQQEKAQPAVVTPKPKQIQPVVQQPQQQPANAQTQALNKQLQDLQTKYQDLSTKVSDQQETSSDQLYDLSKKISGLNNSVSGVQNSVDQASYRIGKIEYARRMAAKRAANAYNLQQQQIRNRKKYYVQAAMPGRAWLRAVDGATVTVAVGDTLPGYGQIKSIDSYSGTVTATYGDPIKYGISST